MTQIFLLAGQSNMRGLGVTTELPETLTEVPGNVRLFEDGQERDILWRSNFGPELGFAHRISSLITDESVILCKTAVGGANLYYDWNPDGEYQGPEDTYRGPLFPALCEELRRTRALLQADGVPEPEISGMMWMQGERDAVFEFMADAYEENLRHFISASRKSTGVDKLPFIIGQIAPRQYDLSLQRFKHQFRGSVQEAQQKVAEVVEKVKMVPTMDLPQSDNLHYTTGGQLELGRRFADACISPL